MDPPRRSSGLPDPTSEYPDHHGFAARPMPVCEMPLSVLELNRAWVKRGPSVYRLAEARVADEDPVIPVREFRFSGATRSGDRRPHQWWRQVLVFSAALTAIFSHMVRCRVSRGVNGRTTIVRSRRLGCSVLGDKRDFAVLIDLDSTAVILGKRHELGQAHDVSLCQAGSGIFFVACVTIGSPPGPGFERSAPRTSRCSRCWVA